MSDAMWNVQRAVYAALTSVSPSLTVYDEVPAQDDDDFDDDSAFPYVTIGDSTAVDEGDKTVQGQGHTLTLHIWSRYHGRREVKQIAAQIYELLHEKPLTVDGADTIFVRFQFFDSFTDEDGRTRHGVARYRVVTNAA